LPSASEPRPLVVAAPVFPLSNDGAQDSFTNSFDVVNQPGDVSFVLDELLAAAESDGLTTLQADPG
jgi:predicted dienelactone hydrolase